MRCLSAVAALLTALPKFPAVAAPPELNIVIVDGEGDTNNIRQHTAREPIVQVEDENHKPVAGSGAGAASGISGKPIAVIAFFDAPAAVGAIAAVKAGGGNNGTTGLTSAAITPGAATAGPPR